MKRKLAAVVLAVVATLAAAVGAGWKWDKGNHFATGKAEHVAGWTWDGEAIVEE